MKEVYKTEQEDIVGFKFTSWRLKSNNKYHREDGPALIYNDECYYYINGLLHNEHGPAVEWEDGSKFWYTKGIRHRENGPAAEWGDGIKEFYLNGKELTEKEFILKRLIKRISKLK